MPLTVIVAMLLSIAAVGYLLGRRHALGFVDGRRRHLHSLPGYHGLFVALCVLLPSALYLQLGLLVQQPGTDWLVGRSFSELVEAAEHPSLALARIEQIAAGSHFGPEASADEQAAADYRNRVDRTGSWVLGLGSLLLAVAGARWALNRTSEHFRARNWSERLVLALLFLCSLVAIGTTVGVVVSLAAETGRFFAKVPATDFFFGLSWSPQEAIRDDQVGSSGAFGVIPVLTGTLLITLIAMAVAVPIGLLSAIYMVEFSGPRPREIVKPALEILAGIPTVVYGFFAARDRCPVRA